MFVSYYYYIQTLPVMTKLTYYVFLWYTNMLLKSLPKLACSNKVADNITNNLFDQIQTKNNNKHCVYMYGLGTLNLLSRQC